MFVEIEDLLSGAYWRRKHEEKERKEKIKAMRKKMELLKWEGYKDDPRLIKI